MHVGGCCIGIHHEKEQMFYMRELKAHFYCYLDHKIPKEQKQLKNCTVKTRWKFEEVKEIIEKEVQHAMP